MEKTEVNIEDCDNHENFSDCYQEHVNENNESVTYCPGTIWMIIIGEALKSNDVTKF